MQGPATTKKRRDRRDECGYSLLDVLAVLALTTVLAATAVLTSGTAIRGARADSALDAVVHELRHARELALADRRNIEVRFVAPNQVRLIRHDVTGSTASGTTTLETITLEGRLTYRLQAGVGDTPDGFGNASAVDFGSATALLFTSEGTLVDQTGDVLNGTVFLCDPLDALSPRAVTIFGPTGLVRGYRWNGLAWTE